MRKPAYIMEKVAKLLEKGDESKFIDFMDGLTEDEIKTTLRFSLAVQDLMMDALARVESNKSLILPQ